MASILIVLALLVLIPSLTYYATSSLFFRKVNSASVEKKPPTIPYFLPGLFHAASFAQLGARKYFAELIKDYGAFAPFKVNAGLRSYIILRDPTHIKRVLEAPEHLSAMPAQGEMFDKLFGSPKATEYPRYSESNTQKEGSIQSLSNAASLATPPAFHIPDATLISTIDIYISVLSENMHSKMFQLETWTRIEDLWSFLQLVLIRCTLNAMFGSALLKRYPRMIRDYLEFNDATQGFVPGMPRVMLFAATTPRDRLHKGIEGWLEADYDEPSVVGETDSADPSKSEPVWDEKKGLRFIREHFNAHQPNRADQAAVKAKVAEVLSIVHTVNNELAPFVFWMTVEILRKSHLTRNMKASIHQCFSSQASRYDILGLSQVPLVDSVQAEVRRLRTANCVVRNNKTNGFPLDKHWSLPKGANVVMFSHDVSLNTDAWRESQPDALEKPLEEFWAERSMAPDRKMKSKKEIGVSKNGPTREDLRALVKNMTTCDQYPGARFISALQMATVAVLFTEFDIELSDSNVDGFLPPAREHAYGTVQPLEKIAVRIRRRKM